jgi:hypothetical protein
MIILKGELPEQQALDLLIRRCSIWPHGAEGDNQSTFVEDRELSKC